MNFLPLYECLLESVYMLWSVAKHADMAIYHACEKIQK